VSLAEPSLQNIPKDFDVELTEELRTRALGELTLFKSRWKTFTIEKSS
jgi:hypothetical protein